MQNLSTKKNATGRLPSAGQKSSLILLAVVLALCLGCSDAECMGKSGIPPWHMWGDSVVVDITSTGASGQGQSLQVVRINYGRPETWRFFLAAETLEGNANAGGSLIVAFRTILGVGRSSVEVPLGVFNFVWPGAFPKTIKFASSSLAPVVDDTQPTVPNVLQTIVAEDIQVQAQVVLVAAANLTAKVKCTAFFAPEGHVRPEWFEKDPRFPGGENDGH
jgi:hypothetical protein